MSPWLIAAVAAAGMTAPHATAQTFCSITRGADSVISRGVVRFARPLERSHGM